ncbi:hypothetical protein V6N11_082666 [Hibiscus sabdariffa]|uniref:Uncharacterized protein n=1 Tax=Hibiscus sabdariffa TaxID=183260 RepID=A0ABR2P9E7_9ROSI
MCQQMKKNRRRKPKIRSNKIRHLLWVVGMVQERRRGRGSPPLKPRKKLKVSSKFLLKFMEDKEKEELEEGVSNLSYLGDVRMNLSCMEKGALTSLWFLEEFELFK